MKLRSLLTLALAATMLVAAPISAKADDDLGWEKKSKGYKFEYADGKYFKDTVQYLPDRKGDDCHWYYFDEKGYMQKGGWITDVHTYDDPETKAEEEYIIGVSQYYANKSGHLQYDEWETIDGQRYYFKGADRVENGTVFVQDKDKDGNPDYDKKGNPEGDYYHFAPTGELTKGWYWHANDGWYYSNSKGVVAQGWETVDGYKYLFLGEKTDRTLYNSYSTTYGRMATGSVAIYKTVEVEEELEDGTEIKYDERVAKDYYYFTPNGTMVTGWYKVSGDASGYPAYYYMSADGTAAEGWVASGSNWYYINENGSMKQNDYYYDGKDKNKDGVISGKEIKNVYYFGRDGVMITGWYDKSYSDANNTEVNDWMYANADGTILPQWVYNNGWYFIEADGTMVKDDAYVCAPYYDMMPEKWSKDPGRYKDDIKTWTATHTFVFDGNGRLVEGGWYQQTTTTGTWWCHAEANGMASQGWVEDNGNWYYCQNGWMMQNAVTPDGFYVGYDGVWR